MLDSSPEDEDFPGRLLHQAALWDNAELLEDLLHGDQKRLINSKDSWGRTPLHAAAITDNSRCLRILLQAGANPDFQCGPRGENRTALHLSAEHGHKSNVEDLLCFNASLVIRDSNGMTAFDIADKCSHTECMQILREAADGREKAKQAIHASLREACCIGDIASVRQLVASLGADAELLINMAPSGANTLLFTACQVGRKEIVKVLLENGADGRIHPITKYSPLYIACYHGHKDIVEMILKRFPELVQQYTVEKWLPIHACCINGHNSILEMLLQFPYPTHLLKKYKDPSHQWEYYMPFDINQKDVTGQNILYVACLLGNQQIVELILKFRVKSTRIKEEDETPTPDSSTIMSPDSRRRISDGIQSIMSRLNLKGFPDGSDESSSGSSNEGLISPVQLDVYCNNDSETSLHAAVRGKHYNIATLLLTAGASPNLPIKAISDLEESVKSTSTEDDLIFGTSSALVEACKNKDIPMTDLLLKYGANDDECKALCVAAKNRDETLTARLLSIKAYPDPEYKINKKAMTEDVASSRFSMFSNLTNLTYSSIFPNVATMINWHDQKCRLSQIRSQWLTDAALHVNPKLKQNPRCHDIVPYAITRLDISSNSLTVLPLAVFRLASLRYLNASQNKIERLPTPESESPAAKMGRRSGKWKSDDKKHCYDCPVLEEMYLQDNRLDRLPEALFHIPSLITLVVSNNKLQHLPYDVWKAPKLKELNVAFNLLKEIPAYPPDWAQKDSVDSLSVCSIESRPSTASSCGTDSSEATTPVLDFSDSESVFSDSEPAYTYVRYRKKNPSVRQLELNKHHVWSKNVEVTEQILHSDDTATERSSKLSALNLAHNLFSSIPACLPCLAVNLTRLNMAYNNLRSMSHITSYPNALKQLDLSHNEITCWPSLPQVDAQDTMETANITCYAPNDSAAAKGKMPILPNRRHSGRSLRSVVLQSVCLHRRHLRLDNLRTLVLADNCLTRIQLSTDDDGDGNVQDEEENDWNMVTAGKSRLIFPNLSMLDISNNNLKEIPHNIHELSNLSVLNISGNLEVSELPPQMGLLSRLWNLNTRGCALQEPLKSMIESKKYKTMDIVGYLKSVLEDARPYARMKLMIVGIQGIGKTSLLERLRSEGVGSYRKKPVEHWTKRMGNKNMNVKTARGTNMSTVGVDIGDWVYEKKSRGHSSHGPVIFRTWDFGGQKEYYATHQYFLSKRSLYLVVWKIPDGQRGIDEILQWLVNIQARAPNSPVLIVGTHYDTAQEFMPASATEDLQQSIRDRFINIVDAEKCGLPRVLDTIEVSCATRHNIKLLCNLIYDTVFSLRQPGSKELLLEQRVPATYLALEDVVGHLATERRAVNADPVLSSEQYRALVTREMNLRYNRTFRDCAELHQATMFLHDNGVLLHYDDATLKDLYFLDPQWLCDMLAHVVTIREINPFARTGVMKLDDLKHIFKSSGVGPSEARGYIVNLLNKFEVALTWDSRTLLIPSLLPSEDEARMSRNRPGSAHSVVRIGVPLRSRGRAVRNKKIAISPKSVLYPAYIGDDTFSLASPGGVTRDTSGGDASSQSESEEPHKTVIGRKAEPDKILTRLLSMSYFPSGFWSRLISRILADDSIVDIVRSFFTFPRELMQDTRTAKALDVKAEWVLWQTGLQLNYGDLMLFRMKEVLHSSPTHYRQLRFRSKQEGVWCEVDLAASSILELYLPIESLIIDRPYVDPRTMVIEPNAESVAQLLALAVDHVDMLLEDWYPTLGTRFVHTSEGKFLVTRFIPCPKCLNSAIDVELSNQPSTNNMPSFPSRHVQEAFGRAELDHCYSNMRRIRKSQESYTSECDSGVGPDSADSSRMPSVEGHPNYAAAIVDERGSESLNSYYGWTVEECILEAYGKKRVECPTHGDMTLSRLAPDTIFIDLGERYLIRPENIKKGRLLGRGAFGFVFRGTCRMRGSNAHVDVAMKTLQPVQPGANARRSAIVAYKAAQSKWDRDPLQYACKAYCTARQELNILLTLRHPNIVPLVGVCSSPLALVLDLAPQGALDTVLRHYRRSGARVGPYTLQAIIVQVARAIEYLHGQRIIYRDLKSENVLVWKMPPTFRDRPDNSVHLKLADYGISRLTLPSGTKGFAGTEGFMAPEIMRYNGEEEYTEKVDCFSFGMFIYELLTLHQPFEGHESVKECILEGGRPPLTYRETVYPSYSLDLMVLCWSQQPRDRPSASQIVSIASAPEFTHLCDVVSLDHSAPVVAATSVMISRVSDDGACGSEMWALCANGRADLLLSTSHGWLEHHALGLLSRPTASCTVGPTIWVGDCTGNVHAYAAADGSRLFSYALEPDSAMPTSVVALLHLPSLRRVACALSNGRLFLVTSESAPSTPTAGEGTFVMTELGSSTSLHSLCCVCKEDKNLVEIWCGESRGRISIFTMRGSVVSSHETIDHYEPTIECVFVSQMTATNDAVWSYVYPGCTVYRWDAKDRTITNKLDCSKLVPCSESLKSIAIEEHLSPSKCQVTSLAIVGDDLYIGTTWGCVIVAERSSMRPITVFRPFEEEVGSIIPLITKPRGPDSEGRAYVATVGRGYRSLVSRYTDVSISPASLRSPVVAAPIRENSSNDIYALLWRAEHWATS